MPILKVCVNQKAILWDVWTLTFSNFSTMSDSDSSEDELGLFSFQNKKKIVATAPVIEAKEAEPTIVDKSLFRKRKREAGPALEAGDSLDDSLTLLDYKEIEDDYVEEMPLIPALPEPVRIE